MLTVRIKDGGSGDWGASQTSKGRVGWLPGSSGGKWFKAEAVSGTHVLEIRGAGFGASEPGR